MHITQDRTRRTAGTVSLLAALLLVLQALVLTGPATAQGLSPADECGVDVPFVKIGEESEASAGFSVADYDFNNGEDGDVTTVYDVTGEDPLPVITVEVTAVKGDGPTGETTEVEVSLLPAASFTIEEIVVKTGASNDADDSHGVLQPGDSATVDTGEGAGNGLSHLTLCLGEVPPPTTPVVPSGSLTVACGSWSADVSTTAGQDPDNVPVLFEVYEGETLLDSVSLGAAEDDTTSLAGSFDEDSGPHTVTLVATPAGGTATELDEKVVQTDCEQPTITLQKVFLEADGDWDISGDYPAVVVELFDGTDTSGEPLASATDESDLVSDAVTLAGTQYTVVEDPIEGYVEADCPTGVTDELAPTATGTGTFDAPAEDALHVVCNEPEPDEPDTVAPAASAVVECDAAPVATLDNSASDVPVVFTISGAVEGGLIEQEVPAGEVATVPITVTEDGAYEVTIAAEGIEDLVVSGVYDCEETEVAEQSITVDLESVCRNDTPYLAYDVEVTGTDATTVRLTWVDADGTERLTTVHEGLQGEVLWPGAELDADGDPIDWPGWVQQDDGTWVEAEDGFGWARPEVSIVTAVNPTAGAVTVGYPPSDPDCSPEPTQPEEPVEVAPQVIEKPQPAPQPAPVAQAEELAATGLDSVEMLLLALLLMGLGGMALLAPQPRRIR